MEEGSGEFKGKVGVGVGWGGGVQTFMKSL